MGGLSGSFAVMARMGRFYVLGPPTRHPREVLDVVTLVMRQNPDVPTSSFGVERVEGPVLYDASWVAGGRDPLR